MLTDSLRTTMTAARGAKLDAALADLGWHDMLDEIPEVAIPLVFRLLGETGAHAPVLNDVVAHGAGRDLPAIVALPFAGGRWVVWGRAVAGQPVSAVPALDPELPVRRVLAGETLPLAQGRRALAWWLVGTSRAMLNLARRHAL